MFRNRKPVEPPLLQLTSNDAFTLHQAHEGILAVGGTGSGKTSTLRRVMWAMRLRGCGMVLLTAKGSDFGEIAEVAREAKREDDLIRFAPGERWRFDFLNFELANGSITSAAAFL